MSKELWVVGTGLIGTEVAKLARGLGIEVTQTTKDGKGDGDWGLDHVDITRYEEVEKYFWDHNFKKVVVAAGVTLPSAAERNSELTYLVNAEGPKNIGLAALSLPINRRPSIVFMGSALQYDITKTGPVTEDTPLLKNGNVYAMSKTKMVEYVMDLVSKGLDARVAMTFNTTGRGQSTDYFLPSMADQVAKITLGLKEPVLTSHYVDHIRDFSHVSDTAEGILLTLKGKTGNLINVSSGRGVRLRDIVDMLIEMSGVSGISHVIDPGFNTPPKIMPTWGDNTYLRSLGFVPKKTITDICRDLFDEHIELNKG